MYTICFFFESYGDHRDLHVRTHSFPTRRSSDLVRAFCQLADRIYTDFGFTYAIKLALRPDKRFGSDAVWDQAEAELRDAVAKAGFATEQYGWAELPGEGAFYAPKLAWHLTDEIGRAHV